MLSNIIRLICFRLSCLLSGRRAKTVVILRTDAIGDYVLFRNFLEILRGAKKYADKRLVLVGNELWRDLAETFDTDFVDEFVWVNPRQLHFSIAYRWQIIKKIRSYRPLEILQTEHSRFYWSDDLVAFSGAQHRVAPEDDGINASPNVWLNPPIFYTQLVPSLPPSVFEFTRTHYFFEQLLGQAFFLQKPNFKQIKARRQPHHIALAPTAKDCFRMWSPLSFAQILTDLYALFPDLIVSILGTEKDENIARLIIGNTPKSLTINNLCGKTNAVDWIQTVANAHLLIGNESASIHIAAAVETPTVCISNGNHFGRFSPYPLSISDKITTIFPNADFYNPDLFDTLTSRFKEKSDLDIQQILPEQVLEAVAKILKSN